MECNERWTLLAKWCAAVQDLSAQLRALHDSESLSEELFAEQTRQWNILKGNAERAKSVYAFHVQNHGCSPDSIGLLNTIDVWQAI